jgi:hypothetical protein
VNFLAELPPRRKHPVSAAGVCYFGVSDLRPVSCVSLLGDDLAQIIDAIAGEGGHPVLADAIDPEAAVFRFHADRQIEEPIFVFAEKVGNVADRKDGADIVLTAGLRWTPFIPGPCRLPTKAKSNLSWLPAATYACLPEPLTRQA